ncbi:Centrosomal protein [Heracleum sosnowskyi]|uniref:Centrosomal protein n=1 Tax=Heracleum sosnowskyi TaxID=360622 RepID=A0AAD8LY25_9APIA|nr:Centrosomal protein [Heracleum sosnowskyi]
MAASDSVDLASPVVLHKENSTRIMESSSPVSSPSLDKRLWSSLRDRVDTILENQNSADQPLPVQPNGERSNRAKRMKEDALLLLRGFDSVSSSLSQLSANLTLALQGARDLSRPPTLSEIVHSTLENTETKEEQSKDEEETEETNGSSRGLKRKIDSQERAENEGEANTVIEYGRSLEELGKFKKCKNIAISMANKAASLARELRSVKSDLCFMKQRCALLEEENGRFRDGYTEGLRPEEDDMMRLQMEALLAEKSRLATENTNLTRENECLNQLVEYHQLTSQDLSESCEHDEIRGLCLDFSSPAPALLEEEGEDIKKL